MGKAVTPPTPPSNSVSLHAAPLTLAESWCCLKEAVFTAALDLQHTDVRLVVCWVGRGKQSKVREERGS